MARKPGTWPKGVSGNPNGRPKKEDTFTYILNTALDELSDDKGAKTNKITWRKKIAEVLIKQAVAGNTKAIELIADRVEGKPIQKNINLDIDPVAAVIMSDQDGQDLKDVTPKK